MTPLMVWLSHPERWAALALLVWTMAFARRVLQARRQRRVADLSPRRAERPARTSALGDLLLMVSAYALVLILTEPAGRARLLLAGLPALAAVLWFGAPVVLAEVRGTREARRRRGRFEQAAVFSLEAVDQLAEVPAPASAAGWLELARQAAQSRGPVGQRQVWRCIDRAMGVATPGRMRELLAAERLAGARAPGGWRELLTAEEPDTLDALEGRTRAMLQALAEEPSSDRLAAGTARAYGWLRELEPGLDPVSARALWWRATGEGRDREEWYAASERIERREPGGLAPETLLAGPLQELVRLPADVLCAAPRLVMQPGLEALADGTWSRAEESRGPADESLLTHLEAGNARAAAGRLPQVASGVVADTVAVWCRRPRPAPQVAELVDALTRGRHRVMPVEFGLLAVVCSQYRRARAAPVLERLEPQITDLALGGAHLRLALGLAWSSLDPQRALDLLKPLIDPQPQAWPKSRVAIGLYRRPLIELLARLRHPDVDDLLRLQLTADDCPSGMSPFWHAAVWSALARRGVADGWSKLDGLVPEPQDDAREWAAQLGRCAAAGSAAAIDLATDYVLGRNGAGPPAGWSSRVKLDCRQRMLERLVAGRVYRRYASMACDAVRGPCPMVPNRMAEVCCDALPLPA